MNQKNQYEIIDMHAHIFPDKIAGRAVETIGSYYNIPMSGPGTVDGLLESGGRIGVSRYIVHSSATNVEQVLTINDYVSGVAASHNELIGFGTLHPGLADVGAEVERVIGLGLKGIKLHPDFQGFNIDDEDMLPIYQAVGNRLPVLIHMGDENRDSSRPMRLARILELFPDLVVIAAHFGGYRMWDESERYLIGRNLYLDTSSALAFLSPEESVRMIRAHGVHKLFFGSDYPMWDHKEELERFLKLDLTEEERKAILSGNARRFIDSLK